MASSGEEDGDEDSPQIRFIDGTKRGKLLVMDNQQIFYLNRHAGGGVNKPKTSYFKCAFRSQGCQSSVVLNNFNLDKGTYDSFKVIQREHKNHEPCVEKIRMLEGKQKEIMERKQEFDPNELENCRHVCLFCCVSLPRGYQEVTCLENVTSFGEVLSIRLDNREENEMALEAFLKAVGVTGRKWKEDMHFEDGDQLPLCYACQMRYQEMWHLRKQIEMLEKLIGKYGQMIRDSILKTENYEKLMGTQLMGLGLGVFRKMVIYPKYQAKKCKNPTESKNKREVPAKRSIDCRQPSERTFTKQLKNDPDNSPENESIEGVAIKQEVTLPPEDDSMWMDSLDHGGLPSPTSDLDDSMDVSEDFVGVMSDCAESESDDETEARKPHTRASIKLCGDSKKKENMMQGRLSVSSAKSDNTKNADVSCNDNDSKAKSKFRRPTTSSSLYSRLKKKITRTRAGATKKQYTCHICDAVEMGYKAFIEHYNINHPEEKRYTCKYCQKFYSDFRDITVHQRKHTGERPYKCTQCTSTFAIKGCLTTHIQLRHSEGITFPCPECDVEYSTKTQLNNHLAAEHGHVLKKLYGCKSGSRKPLKSWTCHLCDKRIHGLGPFLQHYRDVHPEEKRYTCKHCQRHYRDLRDCARHQRMHTGERPFKCADCDKSFRCDKTLAAHRSYLHSGLPYQYTCQECGKQYPSKSALTGHMNSHKEYLLLCLTCGKSFKSQSAFCKHNRIAHEGQAQHSKPITDPSQETLESMGISEVQHRTKCHVCWEPILGKVFLDKHFEEFHSDHQGGVNTCSCGKRFKNYADCYKHAIRHSDNKWYHCDQCPQSFYTSSELRVHGQRHAPLEERKNNVCNVCGMGLVSAAALTRHKKTHEDKESQTRWVCEQCGKSYSERKGLQYHMKIEHWKILPHKCSDCGSAFVLKSELEKHSRKHTGAKPFKCPYCEKYFPYTSSRTRHIREVHKLGKGGKRCDPTPRNRKKKAKQDQVERMSESEEEKATPGFSEGYRMGAPHFSGAHHSAGIPMNYVMHQHVLNGGGGQSPTAVVKTDHEKSQSERDAY